MKKIVIVGAGVSGLACAHFLEKTRPNYYQITIVEKSDKVGGLIQSFEKEGFIFELGPRGFRPHGIGSHTLSLAKDLELELIACSKESSKRYIYTQGKLRPVTLFYLLQSGLLQSLARDLKVKPQERQDESVASFFHRHSTKKFIDALIKPFCNGVFAQSPEEISLQATFANLAKIEREKGSLMLNLFQNLKKGKTPSLYTFRGGMQALPKKLANKFQGQLLLNQEIQDLKPQDKGVKVFLSNQTIDADALILAAPNFPLEDFFPKCALFEQKRNSLTLVHLGFPINPLKQKGFGFLKSNMDEDPLLGITFDSNIFPKIASNQLSLFFKGVLEENQALAFAQKTIFEILRIHISPKVTHISFAKEAIYQYPVGHLDKLHNLEQSLPPWLYLASSRYHGVGVNHCIARAVEISKILAQQ